MTDKEFLEKIKTAYKNYPHPNLSIEQFISWVFKQYGYTESKNINE